jgi:excisionase family DNA binding protein
VEVAVPDVLTTLELARELRVSPLTVRRNVRSGLIPSLRVGRVLRYDLAAVRVALADGRWTPRARTPDPAA